MSTTARTPAPQRRDQPLLVCAMVATVVVAGYLAYVRLVIREIPSLFAHWPQDQLGLLRFLLSVAPYVLFGLVLLAWGRSARQRVAGAACALVAGLADWGISEVFQRIVERHALTVNTYRLYDWSLTLLIPTLITLAWGLARRSGRVWVVGVLVAPLLAGIHRQLQLHSPDFQSWEFHHGQWWVGRLEFMAPMVAGCLACWLIEVGRPSSPPGDPKHPAMESSAST
jgi:hypothetical protein